MYDIFTYTELITLDILLFHPVTRRFRAITSLAIPQQPIEKNLIPVKTWGLPSLSAIGIIY
jgi:hypothetical protein